MNCSDISAFAPLYLAEELDAARAEDFSTHLGICPACRRELGQQTAFDELLRTTVLAEPIDSSVVDRRVRASIHAERRTPRRWMFTAAGVAAMLVVWIVGYRTIISTRTQPVYSAAARDHRLEIVDRQPREWFTDRTSIEALAVREGLPRSTFTAFVPVGYRLAQGKLCFLDGRLFLHLVYANEAGSFSLFLRRLDDAGTSGVHVENFAPEHVAGFQHGQLSALIVSEEDGDAVVHLAKAASEAL